MKSLQQSKNKTSKMSFKSDIDKLETQKQLLENDLSEKKAELQKCHQEIEAAEDARMIQQLAAKKTQENIEIHFSDLVSKAFALVFDDPYTFIPQFVERRNHTECDFFFEKRNNYYRPSFSTGGGVKDICSFACRIAYWRFENTSPILVLDEPFRQLSKKFIPRAAEMLKMLSEEFNLQMIITTHITELTSIADKQFEIENGNVK